MVLERWIKFHDTLVGYIFDHKGLPNGCRVQTAYVREFDPSNNVAVCLDGTYRLGEPGTYEEHDQEIPGGIWKPSLIKQIKLILP